MTEKIKEYFIDNILVIIAITLIILNSVLILYPTEKEEFKEEVAEIQEDVKTEIIENNITVDIKGYVKKPGVYNLKEGQTVNDLIKLAKGITKNGTTKNINLSYKLKDESVVIIGSSKDIKKTVISSVVSCPKIDITECEVPSSGIVENNASITDAQTNSNTNTSTQNNNTSAKVSLNNATKEQLMTLTGIGESKALAIIDYREKNGGFNTIEDLMNVSGIGQSTFDKIKENITI